MSIFLDNDEKWLTESRINDRISIQAKENRPSMKHFEKLRDWELWRFCQGLDEDTCEYLGTLHSPDD